MKVMYPLALVVAAVAMLATSVPASETDSRIESAFKKSFVYKTYLKDENIKISSKDGVVTLSGSVGNDSHKPMAQDTAEALPGVRSVDNRIEITGDRPAENSDTWLSMKVKSTLLFHRSVSSHNTEVTLREGTVTLRGEASSQAQKDLTSEYAKDVDGVKAVNNEMTVAKVPAKDKETLGENIDDASITAQVKMSLLSHRSTSLLKTKVTTTDGIVTLGGNAKNAAEKDLVTKLVTDINGVKSVVNGMRVEEAVSNNK